MCRGDVGCPSVGCEYVLLSLANEEADLVNIQAEQSQGENPSGDTWKKKAELEGWTPSKATKGERC